MMILLRNCKLSSSNTTRIFLLALSDIQWTGSKLKIIFNLIHCALKWTLKICSQYSCLSDEKSLNGRFVSGDNAI